jgi:hypothetical protein
MTPKIKDNRQYNGVTLDVNTPEENKPDIDFNEGESPAANLNSKDEENLRIKSVEIAVEFIKLTEGGDLDDIFACAAQVLKFISSK